MTVAPKDAKTPAAFKVRPNALAETDDARMYALFVASVPEVDREGEVILPESFVTSEWEQNPIWLWAHDQRQLPIGAGYALDGSVACYKGKDALRLGCKFSQANPQGALTYALYKEKTLKMVSVGFISGGAERLTKIEAAQFGHNGPATLVLSPELVECSCVPIGMNRRAMIQSIKSWDGYADRVAVASILDRGHLHGERVPDDMRAALADLAAPRGFKAGHWPKKISNLTFQSTLPGLALKVARSTDMAAPKAPLSAGTVPGKTEPAKVEAKAAPEVKPETPVETKDMTSTDDTAGGTTVNPAMVDTLIAGMEHMLAFCKSMTEATANSDLPANLEYAKALCHKAAELVGEMGEYGTKTYPDHTDLFTESAGMAENYRILEEGNPDEASAGTADEAAANDEAHEEVKAEAGGDEEQVDRVDPDNVPKNDLGKEDETTDDGNPDDKAAEEVVTKKEFNDWHNKAFNDTNAREYLDALEARLKAVEEVADALERIELARR